MLVCRLEFRSTNDDRRAALGRLHILPIGQVGETGTYAALLYGADGAVVDTTDIADFPAGRAGPWPLLACALDRLVGHQWQFAPLQKD